MDKLMNVLRDFSATIGKKTGEPSVAKPMALRAIAWNS
jgi:hypothetical protein